MKRAGAHSPHLTSEQIEEARQLQARGWTIIRIAERLGCYRQTIKRALDPDYAVKRKIRDHHVRQIREPSLPRKTARESATAISIKEDAAARLAEIPPDTRSLTARLAGDPLPGSSALDKRQQA
jgi:AraC-like DNA-binding protein